MTTSSLTAVPVLFFSRVLEHVAQHPGATCTSVARDVLGASSKKKQKRERPRALAVLRSLAYAGLIESRIEQFNDGSRFKHSFWPIASESIEHDVDWRIRALGAEVLRRQAASEAKRWRDRCSVTFADAESVGLDVDVSETFRRMAAWCTSVGLDPMTLSQETKGSSGMHDLVNRLAAVVRRPPFDVLAEILEVDL